MAPGSKVRRSELRFQKLSGTVCSWASHLSPLFPNQEMKDYNGLFFLQVCEGKKRKNRHDGVVPQELPVIIITNCLIIIISACSRWIDMEVAQ